MKEDEKENTQMSVGPTTTSVCTADKRVWRGKYGN